MSWIMLLQLLIVLGALWVGSRYGSLALGAISNANGFDITIPQVLMITIPACICVTVSTLVAYLLTLLIF